MRTVLCSAWPALAGMLAGLLLGGAAAAGEVPHRCEAVFQGPVKGCDVLGTWTVSAAARGEDAARKAVTGRMSALMAVVAEERALKAAGSPGSEGAAAMAKGCPEVAAANVRVVCYPEPQLVEDHLCFAQLRSPDCYRGSSLDIQGIGWKALEKGRESICAAVELGLTEQRATPLQQASCKVECLQRAEVRCTPSGGGR
jgi:hypothetical protein